MIASQGILTSAGGTNSHAAVVARGEGIPAVCGADQIRIDFGSKAFIGQRHHGQGGRHDHDRRVHRNVFVGELPLEESVLEKARGGDAKAREQTIWRAFARIMAIADEHAASAGPRQRRHARPVGECSRARRRGDRPVPHRAHVPRLGARGGGPADDLRGDRGRGAGRLRRAAPAAEGRLRRDLPRDGRVAGDGAPARPTAARVPAGSHGALGRGGVGGRARGGRRRARAAPREGPPTPRDEPDARTARRAPGDREARPVRDAGPRDRGGRRRGEGRWRRSQGRRS